MTLFTRGNKRDTSTKRPCIIRGGDIVLVTRAQAPVRGFTQSNIKKMHVKYNFKSNASPPPQIHFRSETYIALFPPVCLESIWGVEVYLHSFLNSVLDGDVWKLHVFTALPFGTDRTESWLGPKTAVGYFQNSKTTPVGNRTRNSRLYSSWCSHCNDWAISIT